MKMIDKDELVINALRNHQRVEDVAWEIIQ